MTDLTVVILTKNEEKNLRKCVESFRGVAKRFVIVDWQPFPKRILC